MKEILISDLASIVKQPEYIQSKMSRDAWQAAEYETGKAKGVMLAAGEETTPPRITLSPSLSGWYRVYICTVNIGSNKFALKLTSDPAFSLIIPPKERPPVKWASYEYCQEFFWKCADMTDQEIDLEIPKSEFPTAAAVMWLRFEEMTDEETAEHKSRISDSSVKNAHYHFDGNEHTLDGLASPQSVLYRLSKLKDSNAEICSIEFVSDYALDYHDEPFLSLTSKKFHQTERIHAENKQVYYAEKLNFLHSIHVEALAALRMSITNLGDVIDCPRILHSFVINHPEYYCKTRDGRTVQTCSYAYPEVWDFAITGFKEMLDYGFDGISLIMHRGIMIGFESPVTERFEKLYPGIDPHVLPITDDRLNGVWRSFMTKFMTKLRQEVDSHTGRHVKINVITDFSPETARHIGIDIEEWAKNGLIDCVCQDTMELYEEVDDCMNDDGVIDLDKYKEKFMRTETVRRFFGNSPEKLVDGAAKYKEICSRYNVKFYGGIFSWPSSTATILENQRNLKKAGIDHFSVYNFIHLCPHQPYYHALANICRDEIDESMCRISNYRVLSLNGKDISTYNQNWVG